MKIQCKFTLQYPSSDIAEKIKDALEVDNYKFVQASLNGDEIIAEIESNSAMSLLHTIEDYLSCLTTAERVIIQTRTELGKITR